MAISLGRRACTMVVEVLFSEPRLDAAELGVLEDVPPTLLVDLPLDIDL